MNHAGGNAVNSIEVRGPLPIFSSGGTLPVIVQLLFCVPPKNGQHL